METIMHAIMWTILAIFAALALTAYVDHAGRTEAGERTTDMSQETAL